MDFFSNKNGNKKDKTKNDHGAANLTRALALSAVLLFPGTAPAATASNKWKDDSDENSVSSQLKKLDEGGTLQLSENVTLKAGEITNAPAKFTIDGQNHAVTGMDFNNKSAMKLSVESLTLNNLSFIGNKGQLLSLKTVDEHDSLTLNLNDVAFSDNSRSTSSGIKGGLIAAINEADEGASTGLDVQSNGSLTIADNTVNTTSGNLYGGVLYTQGASGDMDIHIADQVTLTGNTATGSLAAGGVAYSNGEFSLSSESGGVVINGNSVTATSNNSNSGASGGAIYAKGSIAIEAASGSVTLSNNKATANGGTATGGALTAWEASGNVTLSVTAETSILIENNSATRTSDNGTLNGRGGALFARSGAFEEDTKKLADSDYGSAIVISAEQNAALKGNTVVSKQAYGGAVYSYSDYKSSSVHISAGEKLEISGNSVSGDSSENAVKVQGGAIFSKATGRRAATVGNGVSSVVLSASGVALSGNSSSSKNYSAYGAIYSFGDQDSFVAINGGDGGIAIEGNSATGKTYALGGAIANGVEGAKAESTSSGTSLVTLSTTNGGNIVLTGNTVKTEGTSTVQADFAAAGGAVFTRGGVAVQSSGTIEVSGNTATASKLSQAGASGGAVYAGSLSAAASGDISMTGNSVTGQTSALGGAVYTSGDVSLASGGSVDISKNTATVTGWGAPAMGGAIYAKGDVDISAAGTASLTGNLINGQSAGSGAAVFTEGAFTLSGGKGITVSGNRITNGQNSAFGGAIYAGSNAAFTSDQGSVEISENSVTNKSNSSGGAVFAAGTLSVNAQSIAIASNDIQNLNGSGTLKGGALYAGGSLSLTSSSDVSVENNRMSSAGSVAHYGAALYSGGTLTVDAKGQIRVAGNTVTNSGAEMNRNTSGVYGTALYGLDGVTIQNASSATFSDNSAWVEKHAQGGSVYTQGQFTAQNLGSLSFTDNSLHSTLAQDALVQGGAIYAGSVSISNTGNVTFRGNSVSSSGYAESGNQDTNNSGFVSGGAISSSGDVSIAGASVIFSGNAASADNFNVRGGAIYALGDVTLKATGDVEFTGNSVSTNRGSKTALGGAIYAEGSLSITAGGAVTFGSAQDDVFIGSSGKSMTIKADTLKVVKGVEFSNAGGSYDMGGVDNFIAEGTSAETEKGGVFAVTADTVKLGTSTLAVTGAARSDGAAVKNYFMTVSGATAIDHSAADDYGFDLGNYYGAKVSADIESSTAYLYLTYLGKNLVWDGTADSSAWSTNANDINWHLNKTTTVKSDFQNGDAVTFDASAANKNVSVDGTVAPSQMSFDNAAGYSFTGTGAINAASLDAVNSSAEFGVALSTDHMGLVSSDITASDLTVGSAAIDGTSSLKTAAISGGTIANAGSLTLSGGLGTIQNLTLESGSSFTVGNSGYGVGGSFTAQDGSQTFTSTGAIGTGAMLTGGTAVLSDNAAITVTGVTNDGGQWTILDNFSSISGSGWNLDNGTFIVNNANGYQSLINEGADVFVKTTTDTNGSDLVLKVISNQTRSSSLVWADKSDSDTSLWTSVESGDKPGAYDRGWYYGSGSDTTYFRNGDSVTFNGRGASNDLVVLAEDITAGTVNFDAGNYHLSSHDLTANTILGHGGSADFTNNVAVSSVLSLDNGSVLSFDHLDLRPDANASLTGASTLKADHIGGNTLTVDGSSIVNAGTISTSGDISFSGNSTASANSLFTSSDVSFASGSSADIAGAMTALGELNADSSTLSAGSMTANGMSFTNGSSVTSTGSMNSSAGITVSSSAVSADSMAASSDINTANSTITVTGAMSGASIGMTGGTISAGSMAAANGITADGSAVHVTSGNMAAASGAISISGASSVDVDGNMTSAGTIGVNGSSLDVSGSMTANSAISAENGVVSAGSMTADGMSFTNDSSVTSTGSMNSSAGITVSSSAVSADSMAASNDINATDSTVTVTGAMSGANIVTSNDSNVRAQSITASGAISADDSVVSADSVTADGNISILNGSSVDVSDNMVSTTGAINVNASSLDVGGVLRGAGIGMESSNVKAGTISSSAGITSSADTIITGSMLASQDISTNNSNVTVTGTMSGASIGMTGGTISAGSMSATDSITASGSNVIVANAMSGANIAMSGDSNVRAQSITASGAISADDSVVSADSVTAAGNISILNGSSVDVSDDMVSTAGTINVNASSVNVGGALSGAGIGMENGSVKAGTMTSTSAISAGHSTVHAGEMTASGDISITTGSSVDVTGNMASDGTITVASSSVDVGGTMSGQNINMTPGSNVTADTMTAIGTISVDRSAVTVNDLMSGDVISIIYGSTVSAGSVDAGSVTVNNSALTLTSGDMTADSAVLADHGSITFKTDSNSIGSLDVNNGTLHSGSLSVETLTNRSGVLTLDDHDLTISQSAQVHSLSGDMDSSFNVGTGATADVESVTGTQFNVASGASADVKAISGTQFNVSGDLTLADGSGSTASIDLTGNLRVNSTGYGVTGNFHAAGGSNTWLAAAALNDGAVKGTDASGAASATARIDSGAVLNLSGIGTGSTTLLNDFSHITASGWNQLDDTLKIGNLSTSAGDDAYVKVVADANGNGSDLVLNVITNADREGLIWAAQTDSGTDQWTSVESSDTIGSKDRGWYYGSSNYTTYFRNGGSVTFNDRGIGDNSSVQLTEDIQAGTVSFDNYTGTYNLSGSHLSADNIIANSGDANFANSVDISEKLSLSNGADLVFTSLNLASVANTTLTGGSSLSADVIGGDTLSADNSRVTAGMINTSGAVNAAGSTVTATGTMTAGTISADNSTVSAGSMTADSMSFTNGSDVTSTGAMNSSDGITVDSSTIHADSMTANGMSFTNGSDIDTGAMNSSAGITITSSDVSANSMAASHDISATNSTVNASDTMAADGSITTDGSTVTVANAMSGANIAMTGGTISAGSMAAANGITANGSTVHVTSGGMTASGGAISIGGASSVDVDGNMASAGTIGVNGSSLDVSGGMTANGEISADNSVVSAGSMTANGMSFTGGSNVTSTGAMNSSDGITVSSSAVSADSMAASHDIHTTDSTVTVSGLMSGANIAMTDNSTVSAGSMYAADTITVNSSTVTLTSGDMAAQAASLVSGRINFHSDSNSLNRLDVNNGTLSGGALNVGTLAGTGTLTLTGHSLNVSVSADVASLSGDAGSYFNIGNGSEEAEALIRTVSGANVNVGDQGSLTLSGGSGSMDSLTLSGGSSFTLNGTNYGVTGSFTANDGSETNLTGALLGNGTASAAIEAGATVTVNGVGIGQTFLLQNFNGITINGTSDTAGWGYIGGAGYGSGIIINYADGLGSDVLRTTTNLVLSGDTDLYLDVASKNVGLTWGTQGGSTWNTVTSNHPWVFDSDTSKQTYFAQNDSVLFNEFGASNNSVNVAANVTPENMTISAGDYAFTGTGSISADQIKADGGDANFQVGVTTNRLSISDGSDISASDLTVNVSANVASGSSLTAGKLSGGTITNAGTANLKDVSGSAITNSGSLTIGTVASTSVVSTGSVTLAGGSGALTELDVNAGTLTVNNSNYSVSGALNVLAGTETTLNGALSGSGEAGNSASIAGGATVSVNGVTLGTTTLLGGFNSISISDGGWGYTNNVGYGSGITIGYAGNLGDEAYRLNADLVISGDVGNQDLVLSVAYKNIDLVWANSQGNIWSASAADSNWYHDATDDTTYYRPNDSVTFNDRGAANNLVSVSGDMTPSNVTITAGDYTFTGANASGDSITTDNLSAAGGDASFGVDLTVNGLLSVSNGSKVSADNLKLGNEAAIASGSSLAMKNVQGGTISNAGTLTLSGGAGAMSSVTAQDGSTLNVSGSGYSVDSAFTADRGSVTNLSGALGGGGTAQGTISAGASASVSGVNIGSTVLLNDFAGIDVASGGWGYNNGGSVTSGLTIGYDSSIASDFFRLDGKLAVVDDGGNKDLVLNVDYKNVNLVWADKGTSVWTDQKSDDKGWHYDSSDGTTYFRQGDSVTFNERGVLNKTVNVSGSMRPGVMTITAGQYAFQGANASGDEINASQIIASGGASTFDVRTGIADLLSVSADASMIMNDVNFGDGAKAGVDGSFTARTISGGDFDVNGSLTLGGGSGSLGSLRLNEGSSFSINSLSSYSVTGSFTAAGGSSTSISAGSWASGSGYALGGSGSAAASIEDGAKLSIAGIAGNGSWTILNDFSSVSAAASGWNADNLTLVGYDRSTVNVTMNVVGGSSGGQNLVLNVSGANANPGNTDTAHTSNNVINSVTSLVGDRAAEASLRMGYLPEQPKPERSIWAHGWRTVSRVDGLKAGSGTQDSESTAYGIMVGSDVKRGNLLLGVAGHIGKANTDGLGSHSGEHSSSDFYGLMAYGKLDAGNWSITGDAGYTWFKTDYDFKIGSSTTGVDAGLFSVGAKASYKIAAGGRMNISPFVGLRYNHYTQDSYKYGTGTADSYSYNQFLLPVGVKFDWENIQTKSGWNLKPSVEFSYIRTMGDLDVNTKIRPTSGGDATTSISALSDANTLAAELKLEAKKANFTASINLNGRISQNQKDWGIGTTFKWEI